MRTFGCGWVGVPALFCLVHPSHSTSFLLCLFADEPRTWHCQWRSKIRRREIFIHVGLVPIANGGAAAGRRRRRTRRGDELAVVQMACSRLVLQRQGLGGRRRGQNRKSDAGAKLLSFVTMSCPFAGTGCARKPFVLNQTPVPKSVGAS